MVRTNEYKLVVFHGEDRGELYDLRQDPGEHENKWADPAYQAVKGECYSSSATTWQKQ